MRRGRLSTAMFGALAATLAVAPVAAQYYRVMPVYGSTRDGTGDRGVDYDRGYGPHGPDRSERCRGGGGGAIIGAIAGGLLGSPTGGYGTPPAGTFGSRSGNRDC